jgi:hypothetical protein
MNLEPLGDSEIERLAEADPENWSKFLAAAMIIREKGRQQLRG